MLSYQQALAIIASNIRPLEPIQVRPSDAAGWVAAAALNCKSDVPPFDNSAMDGFALRSQDTAGAHADKPVRLAVLGSVFAGDNAVFDPAFGA